MYLLASSLVTYHVSKRVSLSTDTYINTQGVSKGLVAEKIFTSMDVKTTRADFVLCIGDDRSDEDMFESINNALARGLLSASTSVFACTVGQKPSKAKYYLDDTSEVISMLDSLADATYELSSDEECLSPPSARFTSALNI